MEHHITSHIKANAMFRTRCRTASEEPQWTTSSRPTSGRRRARRRLPPDPTMTSRLRSARRVSTIPASARLLPKPSTPTRRISPTGRARQRPDRRGRGRRSRADRRPSFDGWERRADGLDRLSDVSSGRNWNIERARLRITPERVRPT